MAFHISLFLLGCTKDSLNEQEEYDSNSSSISKDYVESYYHTSDFRTQSDFPSQRDLAIFFHLNDDPVISTRTLSPNGGTFLPYSWYGSVMQSFYSTDVADALASENTFDEWRLVSVRITPCPAMGTFLAQDIDLFCWPTVRLVWQPVVEDVQVSWGRPDYYADDRAIHAIYPLNTRDRDGQVISNAVRNDIRSRLESGQVMSDIPEKVLKDFVVQRDNTALWLLDETYQLRDPYLPDNSWEGFDVRPELSNSSQMQQIFEEKLITFLGKTANKNDLAELTAFSLPEGRSPAHLDTWVFVAFSGNNGRIFPKDIKVIDRETGDELINIGPSQTASMGREDIKIQEAIEQGNQRLEESIIEDLDDANVLRNEISNPSSFFVPNTSCASCHKINDIIFNFHALSHFEDQPVTVSQRVEQDVLRDILFSKTLIAQR